MAKLAILLVVTTALSVLVATSRDAQAGKPCTRTKFSTTLVADACRKGGQAGAKDAMKAFLKDAKKQEPKLGCPTCHTKVGGDYPLKPDGLERFKHLGGV